ncbi:MAG: glycosyltransferase [Bifidobacteriaceae bacterium]|jgi:glycosyltransferase involved in cell wall biosynthesis|nr:glycosyltransferase [Bifidobacteriaceae bacterium]
MGPSDMENYGEQVNRRVAVVMAVRNGMKYLPEQLGSIVGQSCTPSEIAVVDDMSTDGSAEYIEVTCREIAEVKVLSAGSHTGRSVNGRIGANFAKGLRATSPGTDLIAFCDQDDIWEPDRLEHQTARLSCSAGRLMTTSDAEIIDGESEPTGSRLWAQFGIREDWNQLPLHDQIQRILAQSVAVGATSMIRREFALAVGDPPRGLLHDRWWSIAAATHGGLDLDPTVTVKYRVHAGQAAGLASNSRPSAMALRLVREPADLVRQIVAISALRKAAPEAAKDLSYRSIVRAVLKR